jgi:hypothetical protein
MRVAIGAVGVLTLASGSLAWARMPETHLRRTGVPLDK